MGWADCGSDDAGRPIGYGVAATCDEPGCTTPIDRGLAYVCGGSHGGGSHGCGRYFCEMHLCIAFGGDDEPCPEQLCGACAGAYEAAHQGAPDEAHDEEGNADA